MNPKTQTLPSMSADRRLGLFLVWTSMTFMCQYFGKRFLDQMSPILVMGGVSVSNIEQGALAAALLTVVQTAMHQLLLDVRPTDSVRGHMLVKLAHVTSNWLTNFSMACMFASFTFTAKLMEPIISAVMEFAVLGSVLPPLSIISLPIIVSGVTLTIGNSLRYTNVTVGFVAVLAANILLACRNVYIQTNQGSNGHFHGSISWRLGGRGLLTMMVSTVTGCLLFASSSRQEILSDHIIQTGTACVTSGLFYVGCNYLGSGSILSILSVDHPAISKAFGRILVVILLQQTQTRENSPMDYAGLAVCTVGLCVLAWSKRAKILPTDLLSGCKENRPMTRNTITHRVRFCLLLIFLVSGGMCVTFNSTTLQRYGYYNNYTQTESLQPSFSPKPYFLYRLGFNSSKSGRMQIRNGIGVPEKPPPIQAPNVMPETSVITVMNTTSFQVEYIQKEKLFNSPANATVVDYIDTRSTSSQTVETDKQDSPLLLPKQDIRESNSKDVDQLWEHTFGTAAFDIPHIGALQPDLSGYLSDEATEIKEFLQEDRHKYPTRSSFLSKQLRTSVEVTKEAQRLHLDVLGKTLRGFKYAMLFDIAAFENKGDPCITVGEVYFIARLHLKIIYYCSTYTCTEYALAKAAERATKYYSPKDLVILSSGGGNMVGYPDNDHRRFSIIKLFRNYQKLVFPQSIYIKRFDDGFLQTCEKYYCCNENLTLVMRDEQSYKYAMKYFNGSTKFIMAPDMVFQVGHMKRFMSPVFDIMWIKRSDVETPGYTSQNIPDAPPGIRVHVSDWREWNTPWAPNSIEQAFYQCTNGFFYLQRGRVLVTDRLHGHILATLMNIPHVLIDNKHFKLSSYHNTWTVGLENTRITDNPAKALSLALELLKHYNSTLPPRLPFLDIDERKGFSKIFGKPEVNYM